MSIKFADIPKDQEEAPLPPVQPLEATAPIDDEHWNKVFTDQEYFDGIAKSRGVTEAMRTSLHGEDYPYRQAMMGYLAASRNVPMEDVRKIYDEEKDGFAQRVLGKPTASSRELFDWQKQQFARANERNAAARTMMENVIKRSLEDALTGGSNDHTRAVTEDLTSYGEMFNEAEQLDLRKKADELDIQVRRAQAMVSEDARWLFDALRQNTGAVDRGVAAWQGGQAVPEMEEVAKRFATLPEQQRKAVYELVAGFGQIAKVDKGFWYQMAESLGRGASDVGEVTMGVLGENALQVQLAQLEDTQQPVFLVRGRTGEVRVEKFDLQGTGPASPEQRAQAAERIREKLAVRQVQRELRDLAERVVDPIKTVTNLPEILEEGLYGAARSLPYTAVAAVPYAGLPAVATALYAQNYDRLRLEHPELPAGKVALVAAASAPIEAALERLQVKLITGRLPWLGGLVKKMAHPNQRNITRIMLGSGGILLEQNAQETVQELTFPVARTVAAALDEDMPGFDWQEKIEGMPRELAVQFVALLPLSLVGMGALTARELRRGGDYIKDKANLEKVGLSPEQVDRVLGAETLEEAEAIYQEEYNRRDPERAKAAATKLIEEMANTPNLSQKPEMPTVERQGADYVVRNREGVEMLRTQDPDAATYEFNKLMQSREQAFYEAQVALVEMLRKAKEARGLTPDISEIELVAKEVIEPYATMTPEELAQRRKQYELEYGTEAAGALEVVGVNVAQMRDGVFRDVSKIVRGSDPLVVVEEVVEGELKRAWQDGRFSREDMIGWIRQYERASGENILTGEGDADVIEATSSLGVAYFMGQSRRDSLPDKLRAFFEWLSQYLRAIMARAVRLEQALAEGEVDQRFEAFLAQSLGMDLDAILEKQAKAALDGILTGTEAEGQTKLAQPKLTDPSGVARGKEFARVNEQNVQAINAYLDGLEEGFYPVINGDGEQTYVVKVTRRKDGSKRVELWSADGKDLVGDRRSVVSELNYAPSQDGQGNTVWTKAELGAGQKRIYEELTPEQEEELRWQAMQEQRAVDGVYPVAGPSYAVRLVSVHKLSEENLAFAEKMGGLAVPSVAVTKVGNVVDGFGKVALIGGRELGDPEANPVFDADAYTSRFPRPEYKKVKQAVAQRVVNKLRPYEQKFADGYGMTLQEVWDNAVNRPQPDETVNKLLRSNMAKAAYLGLVEGVEVEPQMREVPQRWGLMGTRAMQEYVAQGGGFNLNYDDAAGLRRLAEVVMAAVEEQVAGKSPEVQRMLREAMRANVNEDGTFAFGRQLPLEQDARNYGKMEVDAEATGKVLDEALRGKEAAFDRWVNETIRGMYEAPRIKVNGRWEPYTLENIVRVMTAGRIVGAEQTMTFGEGQLRAASSRRFGSVQEMKNVAEEGIATEAEVQSRRDVVNARLGAWREALMGYYKWQSSWDALDNSMMAMAGYLKARSSTETAMRRALLSKDFVGVPAEVVREGMEIAAEFRNVPVPYFESKPQRVVRLGEFKAAVVAGDVSPETVNILNRHGIEVYTVDSASTAADEDVRAAMEKAGEGVSFAVRPSGAGAGENVAVLEVVPKLTGMSKRVAAETILPVLRGYQKLEGDALPFNKDLGQRVRFSGKTTGTLVSYASHTLEDMELAFILPMLIENAVLVESRADRYGNPEIRSVKILASVARVNGKVYAAKLTVFDRQDGAVLYDVTGKEMRLAPSVVQVPEGTSTTLASLGANVDDLVRAVKGESDVSRAVRSQRYYDEVERALVALDNDPVYRRGRVGSALKRFKKIRDQFSRKDAEPLSQMEAIAFMEALISILPPQMQGRVGGRVRIAQFKTAQGRRNYILNRIAKVDEVLEEYLREEYNADAVRLFARARPQRDEAGQKPKGKLGYSVHELFKTLQEATEWTPEEAEAHVAKLEKRMGAEEISAEEEAHIALESQLVPLFADWLHADAQRRQDAVMLGQEVWTRAYQAERARVERMRQEREAAREELARAAGSEGDIDIKKSEQEAKKNGLSAKWRGVILNLLNFDQVISYVFGEKSEVVRKLVTAQRKADNAKADGIASRSEDWAQFVSRLGGGAMAGQTLVYELSRMNETVRGIKFSQLQLVSITMMWKQAKGREHMLGKLDESGEPMGKWHYNQAFVDEAEAKLRPEAVAIREYLLKKYDEEYDALNAVYRRVYGLNLPKEQFYSPLVVEPVMRKKDGMAVDPVTNAVYPEGSRSPGALRNRGAGVAKPLFRDALQTYFAHMLQMEHWKAYAVLNGEMTAVMGHRDIREVVEAKAGNQAEVVVSMWLQFFNEGGSKDAAAHLALNEAIGNTVNRASAMALFGRISTLVLQSTQMGAAAAKMPLGSYLKRLSMLLTGQMGWGESLRSPYVQRRIAEMPPQVQIAMQGLLATKPNKVREAARKLGRLISGFDGLFTAGTYAMVYDYQRGLALKNGMTRQEAEAFAREEAERITDEVAQPTRAGARSIWELNTTNPLFRMTWAFGSEARKNMALLLFSLTKRSKGELGRALLFVMVFNGLLAMLIRNAFRDLKDGDDDELFDEKNWGWGRMAAMWVSEPLYGIPVIGEEVEGAIFAAAGEYQPKSGLLDVSQAVPALMRLPETAGEVLTGEADWRQVVRDGNRLLMAGGLMSSTLAAAASLSNLARDVFEIGESRVGNDE